ncbi:hypothetical protein V1477_009331 [Vespula maculifrons]|uniref:Uncharacterized protein n=1 Tax=Vespula maculifrons TaxID=7453 RepID=A0ABD2C9G9_VESMC
MSYASQRTETRREKQYCSVREAAECIMVFDGSNVNPKSFIRACENARDLVHPIDIPYLGRIIRSRIRGEADIYLSYVDTDFDEIIYEIKRIYVQRQSQWKWQNELGIVKQESNETPLQYGLRIEKIVRYTKEKIRECNNPETAIEIIKDLEDTALDNFIAGLKNKELENKVNYTRPKSLLEAIGNARIIWDCIKHKSVFFSLNFNDIYRSQRLRRTYYDYYPYRKSQDVEDFMPTHETNSRNNTQTHETNSRDNTQTHETNRRDNTQTHATNRRDNIQTHATNRRDNTQTYATNKPQSYTDVDTYDRQRQHKTNNVEYEYVSYNASDSHCTRKQKKIVLPDISCEYCKHAGHVIEECRAFVISRKYCERCEIRGHTLNECHRIQNPLWNIQSNDYSFIHKRVYTFYHSEQVVGEYKTLRMRIKNTVNTTEFWIDTFVN